MKRALIVTALVLTGLVAFPMTARADHGRWGFGVGFGVNGGSFQFGYSRGFAPSCTPVYSPPRHIHSRAPIYRQVWVPAVYDRVVVGYDHCGRPICRTVLVRSGYYNNVIVGYRCDGCGVTCG